MISHNNRLLITCILITIFIGGCVNPFHPNLRFNNDNQSNTNTPLIVLKNLETAYCQRDIKLLKNILAPDFRFELVSSEVNLIGIDVNHDGIRDSWWGVDQEIEFTDNLFNRGSSDGIYQSPEQIVLRLQIPPESQWVHDPDPAHEGWLIISCLFDLQLIYSPSSTITSNGSATFYLKQINNRWYIAIWRDESNI